jgi:hypothetical protein
LETLGVHRFEPGNTELLLLLLLLLFQSVFIEATGSK